MSVNLLEENRLVYHDKDGETLELIVSKIGLILRCDCGVMVLIDCDAVETLRDSLTCWLETGKFTR